MAALEDRARPLGYRWLRLETGDKQDAAILLYRRLGYEPIEPWGPYVDMPWSVCMEKALAADPS
jgi:hypothetical protein